MHQRRQLLQLTTRFNRWCILIALSFVLSISCIRLYSPHTNPVNDNFETSDNSNSTSVIAPVFPDNYRETFVEVRDCRLTPPHDGLMVRVLVNEIARDAYLSNANPLPVGSVIIKEAFSGPDCADDARITQWWAMRKEPPGFDTTDGDWHWQLVLREPHIVFTDGKTNCIGCHSVAGCLERDHVCTPP